MIIGVPTEIKSDEHRVGLVPSSVRELVSHGHSVIIQSGAGVGAASPDDEYISAGAELVPTAAAVFERADMVVKVKEPQAVEIAQLREGQILFTYLHLAPDLPQTEGLLASGATAIAYETVVDDAGRLPLLTPMSQVAGRLAVQAGARCLESPAGGSGTLLGGVPGVPSGRVVVIGGGVVGVNSIEMAVGLGAQVTVLDRDLAVLDRLSHQYGNALETVFSTNAALDDLVTSADLVVGAVLVVGAEAPKLVTADMVDRMRNGSVLVDVAIDQGGCFETSRATTHQDPTYVVNGVVHYCVANMPGAVPRTSTKALNNVTLPYALRLADHGLDSLLGDKNFLAGLNVHRGHLTNEAVAEAHGMDWVEPATALG
ncbi:MAG: alanine dehydrogenase [Actinomycetia bacterium]|nr:alanine dehydrogenase [Actinomycetes bacterium]MCP4961033.1 alanine dehydrogenase [Actinomycetes bacterium]